MLIVVCKKAFAVLIIAAIADIWKCIMMLTMMVPDGVRIRVNGSDPARPHAVISHIKRNKMMLLKSEYGLPEVMCITKRCCNAILDFFESCDKEYGGIIGSDRSMYYVNHFWPDFGRISSRVAYEPDTDVLNMHIKRWADAGICFFGVIHSHTNGCDSLSREDELFICKQLASFSHLPFMWFPIVTESDGIKITFYKCSIKNGNLMSEKYVKVNVFCPSRKKVIN